MAEPEQKRRKVRSKAPYGKARLHCFTLYHTAGFDSDSFDMSVEPAECPIIWPDKAVWGVCQIERCPDTKRFHVQGAVYFSNPVSPTNLIDTWGSSNHFEKAKGSAQDNFDYCTKSDSRLFGPWSMGTMPKQGKRTDWDDVKDDLQNGKTVNAVLLEHPHLAPCKKGIEALAEAVLPPVPIKRDIFVWYIWGSPGVGKSHRVHYAFPNAYCITGKLHEGKSFDRYAGEDTLILDEWQDYEWPLTTMNGILDCWRLTLQCRYANREARWTTVVIVTNHKLSEAYPAVCGLGESFRRRINREVEIVDKEQNFNFEK